MNMGDVNVSLNYHTLQQGGRRYVSFSISLSLPLFAVSLSLRLYLLSLFLPSLPPVSSYLACG